MIKLKNLNFDKNLKFNCYKTKKKNLYCDKLTTEIVTKQKNQIMTNLKNLNCDKTKKKANWGKTKKSCNLFKNAKIIL